MQALNQEEHVQIQTRGPSRADLRYVNNGHPWLVWKENRKSKKGAGIPLPREHWSTLVLGDRTKRGQTTRLYPAEHYCPLLVGSGTLFYSHGTMLIGEQRTSQAHRWRYAKDRAGNQQLNNNDTSNSFQVSHSIGGCSAGWFRRQMTEFIWTASCSFIHSTKEEIQPKNHISSA